MGFSTNERMVRVDFFKPSGKWYATEAVEWTGEYGDHSLIHWEYAKALHDFLTIPEQHRYRYQGMNAICLEPYHQNACPISLSVDDIAGLVAERGRHRRD